MKIFGRDPAAFVGILEAILPLAVALGILNWSSDQIGAVTACLIGVLTVVTAFYTKSTSLAVLTQAAKALFVLVAAFGFTLAPDVTSGVLVLITVLFGFFQRSQTEPLENGTFREVALGPVPVAEVDAELLNITEHGNPEADDV